MKKKLKISLAVIIVGIIVAGIITTAIWGLNFGMIYSRNKQLSVYIGKSFELNDIEKILEEVIGKNDAIIQKVELYEDMVSIRVKDISDEQVEELNNKINEKYELENKVGEELVVAENANIRGRDLIKQYVYPIAISFIIIVVYLLVYMIVKNKMGSSINVAKSLGKIVLSIVLVQLVYLSIVAITRMPINRLTIPFGIVLYIVTTILAMNKIEKK